VNSNNVTPLSFFQNVTIVLIVCGLTKKNKNNNNKVNIVLDFH